MQDSPPAESINYDVVILTTTSNSRCNVIRTHDFYVPKAVVAPDREQK